MRKPTNPKETAQIARLEAGDFAAFKQELLASVRLYADIEAGRTCMGSPVLAENVLAGIEWQIDALARGVVPSAPSPPPERAFAEAVARVALRAMEKYAMVLVGGFSGEPVYPEAFVAAVGEYWEHGRPRGVDSGGA